MKWFLLPVLLLLCCLANAQCLPELIPYLDRSSGLYGYMNTSGKVVLPAQWASAGLFANRKAFVSIRAAGSGAYSRCVIDSKGQYTIPPQRGWNGEWRPLRTPAAYSASQVSGRTGNFFFTGGPNYQPYLSRERPALCFSNYLASLPGLNACDTVTHRWGIVDTTGRMIIPAIFDNSAGRLLYDQSRREFLFAGKSGGHFGVINLKGDTLIPFRYDALDYHGGDTMQVSFIAGKEGRQRLISLNRLSLLPGSFASLRFEEGMWHVRTDSTEGVYSAGGLRVIPAVYQQVVIYADSIVLKKRGMSGIWLEAVADRNGAIRRAFHTPFPIDESRLRDDLFPSRQGWCGTSAAMVRQLQNGIPDLGMPAGGKTLYSVQIKGKAYRISPNPGWQHSGAWRPDWYLIQPESNYAGDTALYGIIDTAQRVVLAPQSLRIANCIDGLVQCIKQVPQTENRNRQDRITWPSQQRFVLLNLAGKEVSPLLPCRVVAVLRTRNSAPRYLCSREEGLMAGRLRLDLSWQEAELQADTVLGEDGSAATVFDGYRPLRALPADDAEALGLRNSFFAMDSAGRVGLLNADGRPQLPGLSFRYPSLRYLSGDTLVSSVSTPVPFQDNGGMRRRRRDAMFYRGATARERMRGVFAVKDGQGLTGYFLPDGRAALPGLNFRYPQLVLALGTNLYLCETSGDDGQSHLLLLNEKNEDLLQGAVINGFHSVHNAEGLYQLVLGGNLSQEVYVGSNGVIYLQ